MKDYPIIVLKNAARRLLEKISEQNNTNIESADVQNLHELLTVINKLKS